MKGAGIVAYNRASVDKGRASRYGLQVRTLAGGPKPFWQRTLMVGPGVSVPWDLIVAGFHFIERWDAAAPLWRYGVLAKDQGTAGERKRTEAICKDLRMVLYEPALLFVRGSKDGRALLAAWQEEQKHGKDERLAFLRALHLVKPMFCTLPRSWLSEVRDNRTPRRGHTGKPTRLVRLEVEPGRFVQVHPGTEDLVLEQFRKGRRVARPRRRR